MKKLLKNRKGESLIEILLSVMLLSIIAAAFLRSVTSLVKVNLENDNRLDGTYMAERYMEYVTASEGITLNEFAGRLSRETGFSSEQLTASTPYRFKITESRYPGPYCVISIDYKYFGDTGNLSRVRVMVYDNNDLLQCTLENAVYWV
jgi:type II secretory pathway pseudopilin PulG